MADIFPTIEMRSTALITAATLSGLAYAQNQNRTQGFDISSNDTDVDFEGAYNSGARYVSIRVRTEQTLLFLAYY